MVYKNFHWPFFLVSLLLACLGLLVIHSASVNLKEDFMVKQAFWLGIGLISLHLVLWMGYRSFLNLAYLFYGLSLALLVIVLLFGPVRQGAQRWLDFGPIALQPSEIAKLSLILALARYLGAREKTPGGKKGFLVAFLLTMVPLVLIVKQPDLGTALIFLPILLWMLFLWGIRLRYLAASFLLGLTSLPFLWGLLKTYQKRRILVFFNPNLDPLGSGYNAIQSKIAVGSGGLLGKGYLHGTQVKLHFLPEHHTDFIFCVLSEEWGFLGGLILLVLLGALFLIGFKIIQSTADMRARLLATGILAMILFHTFVNMGMTMGIMPITGLPLPFLSYGGSSLTCFLISIGLLLSVYRERSIF